ncbi:MAG TPA: di-heme enzyme [Longimicrobiales bacterium]|nr:di-heme enzyme [Longimicrobiales bacterium]
MLERSSHGTHLGHHRHGLGFATALTAAALVSTACGDEQALLIPEVPDETLVGFEWQLPPGFPQPRVPEDDPMSAEKVALGRHLFYDKRLSGNETQSCASCHEQALAFTDGKQVSVGSTGHVLPRSAMSLANIGYQPVLTWADRAQTALAEQATIPMFAEDPVELGLSGLEEELLGRLRADATYDGLFSEAFPDAADPFTIDNVTRAIASFERTLISGNSPEDRFRRGDPSALSASAQAGRNLFFSVKVRCAICHSSSEQVFFTKNVDFVGRPTPHVQFDNTGLYNLTVGDEEGWYPVPNTGLHARSGNLDDMGHFKVPSLRNIALTAPYMHDGSIATLEEVLDHYAAGGRAIDSGPYAGVGSLNPYKSRHVTRFELDPEERQALIDYLHALTDEDFVTDPRFSNPWPDGSPAHGQPASEPTGA